MSLGVCYINNLKQEISFLMLKEHVFVHLLASFSGGEKESSFSLDVKDSQKWGCCDRIFWNPSAQKAESEDWLGLRPVALFPQVT